MITAYDYLSIVFYFVFVVTVGITFSRRNKNTSDYFRGGGIMPWWMAGVSAWMASFSAWTFTGAAGKIFSQGAYVLCLYYSSIAPLVVLLCFTCYRFRRMRVVTPLEAIRLRFGPATQQFVTWIRLPFLLLFGGVGLNTVGVFMSGAFDVNLQTVIVILGVMVTFVSLVGGGIWRGGKRFRADVPGGDHHPGDLCPSAVTTERGRGLRAHSQTPGSALSLGRIRPS